LWHLLGEAGLVAESHWPRFDAAMLVEDTVEIAVQVNGKLRGRVTVPSDADEAAAFAAARAEENVAKWLDGKSVVKQIYVPGRMVTLVVRQ
jgi:leucyl-tRNA synthetase